MEKNGKGTLGVWDGWSIGTGAMMGASIFVVSGTASGIAGPAAALGFFLAAVVAMVVALCYSEIATAFPETGGAYVYPRKVIPGVLGEVLSFSSGWALFGGQGIGSSMVALTTAEYINWTLKCFNIINPIPSKVVAFALIIFYAVLNINSFSGGRLFQLVTTIAIAGIMVLYCIWGARYVDTSNYSNFMPNGLPSLFTATAMALMSYGAWSVIPSMGQAFRHPTRDIPLSMFLSLITCGLVFGAFVLVMNGLATPEQLAATQTPATDAFLAHNRFGSIIVAFGGVFACVSSSNSHVMTSSRLPFKMSHDGFLPRALGQENQRGIPQAAILFLMVCQIVAVATSTLQLLVQMIVFVTSVSWLITLISASVLRRRHPEIKPAFRMPLYPLTLILAFLALVILMTRFTARAMIIGCVWIALGILVYFAFTKTGLKKFCEKTPEE